MTKNIIQQNVFKQTLKQMQTENGLIELERLIEESNAPMIQLPITNPIKNIDLISNNLVERQIMLKFIQIMKNQRNLELLTKAVNKFPKDHAVQLSLTKYHDLNVLDTEFRK